jgi:hypothetical protein
MFIVVAMTAPYFSPSFTALLAPLPACSLLRFAR